MEISKEPIQSEREIDCNLFMRAERTRIEAGKDREKKDALVVLFPGRMERKTIDVFM